MKSKTISRLIAGALSAVMTICCVCAPAFAAPLDHPGASDGSSGMEPVKKVTPIGTHSYYKIGDDGVTVIYADREIEESYTAVPSAYIDGSEYNIENLHYGMYVDAGEVSFVDLSLCTANPDGLTYSYYHGTKDSATVSVDKDTATNSDPEMETQFYIHLENGVDPDGTEKEEVEIKETADERVKYEITVATKTAYQLKATVPMYVCMYGYRGSGNVVTPTQDAYQLKNYSSVTGEAEARIVDIVKLTEMTRLYDKDHSNEEIYSIGYKEGEGYTYWYSKPSSVPGNFTDYTVIEDKHITASGEVYVIYIDGTWTFKAAGVLENGVLKETVDAIDSKHPLTNDFVHKNFNFGKEFAIGAQGTPIAAIEHNGLAIKVTDLQAKPATWKLVGMDKSVADLKRGELSMTLAPEKAQWNASAIDLSSVSAKTDITERGWFLAAPKVETDGSVLEENATTLGLITKAQMAGGNVNASGCTPVVKVCYTISPCFADGDIQIGTDVAGEITSNR